METPAEPVIMIDDLVKNLIDDLVNNLIDDLVKSFLSAIHKTNHLHRCEVGLRYLLSQSRT